MDVVLTPRLMLRRWRPDDEAAMATINRDAEVTSHLNRPLDAGAVDGFYTLMVDHWAKYGYGPWVIESREKQGDGAMLGLAGLAHLPPFLADAGTGPELGWRLARSAWGRGVATEAAAAARDDAFGRLGLPEIVSVIHPDNQRSQRVAVKLGMRQHHQIANAVIGRLVDVWHVRAEDVRSVPGPKLIPAATSSGVYRSGNGPW